MKSVWQDSVKSPGFPQLHGDHKTDVLIIGGGIAGILTAYFLEQKGVSYILAEKNKICGGTTGRTTAKLTFQHGLIYDKLLRNFGVRAAKAYLSANRAAFCQYSRLCENKDCDYEIKDNYVYSSSDRRKLEREAAALEKIGYGAEFCERIPLPVDTVGAVKFKDQAQFNPLKFLYSLARDLNIYENTFAREITENAAVYDMGKITADKIIVVSHFPFINKHGAYFVKLYQRRSYVIALENAQKVDGMYVDENKKGMSFRNYGGLLLLGGGGGRTGKPCGGAEELRAFAKSVYPQSRELYSWAAQDCMSLDNMPYIGRYSKKTHELYTASGFNKWGMTGAMLSAMILSDELCGVKNDYAWLFSPSRSILKPQLFINGFESAAGLLSLSGKRCPHLGCALKWNSAERSWDCPCHGSRFDADGKLLDNPANGDLKSP